MSDWLFSDNFYDNLIVVDVETYMQYLGDFITIIWFKVSKYLSFTACMLGLQKSIFLTNLGVWFWNVYFSLDKPWCPYSSIDLVSF